MGIRYFPNTDEFYQGGEAWLAARCGLLTASEMKLILTAKTLKAASNDKERAHLYELLAQRVMKYVEPGYDGANMIRGHDDEIVARGLYHKEIAPVEEMGFITNDKWGFTLGFSPDGLVGDDLFIECKSRKQKLQFETIIECVGKKLIPEEYLLQVQTGFLVSERSKCDFLSFSGGIGMPIIRAYPDPVVGNAIIEAAGAFEQRLAKKLAEYNEIIKSPTARFLKTERRKETEMYLS
jgi:hypothetical protein